MSLMQTRVNKLMVRFSLIDRERMQGLPFYNQNLQIEVAGFKEVDAGYVGVLITPWFINLVLLYKQQPNAAVIVGHKCKHILPSGEYEFMIGEDESLGRYDFISLLSPTNKFKSQQQAIDFSSQKAELYLTAKTETSTKEQTVRFVDKPRKEMTRRSFLGGDTVSEK